MSIFVCGNVTLESVRCSGCGVTFAMPDFVLAERRNTSKRFHCPNGCHQYFGETEADRLRKQLAREKAAHDQTRAEEYRQRELAKADRHRCRAFKGQVTKIKNRVSKGVCPCCNRFFKNLHRHMASKHPDYAGDGKAKNAT